MARDLVLFCAFSSIFVFNFVRACFVCVLLHIFLFQLYYQVFLQRRKCTLSKYLQIMKTVIIFFDSIFILCMLYGNISYENPIADGIKYLIWAIVLLRQRLANVSGEVVRATHQLSIFTRIHLPFGSMQFFSLSGGWRQSKVMFLTE